jgi:hypothetical protein
MRWQSQQSSSVDFYVEEFRRNERVADPFLVAQLGDQRVYLAVWDEPKFEGRKSA